MVRKHVSLFLIALGLLGSTAALEFACQVDIVKNECPADNFVTCLLERKVDVVPSCAAYLDEMMGCYDEVKTQCGDRPTFMCIADNLHRLSDKCIGSAFVDDVLAAVGQMKSAAQLQAEEAYAKAQSVLPCLEDFNALQCPRRHPAETISCLKSEANKVAAQCRSYISGIEHCFDDVVNTCGHVSPKLECLWKQRETLSESCKVSTFFRHVEDYAESLVQRVKEISIPDCAVDVITLQCNPANIVSCLTDNRDHLTASCAKFLTAMEGCYSSVQEICEGARNKFMCLVSHRDSLSEDCRASPFFMSALDTIGQVRAKVAESVLTTLESHQDDIRTLHPCLSDMEVGQCDTKEPRQMMHCLRKERQRLTKQCQAYLQGMDTCLDSLRTACADSSSLADCIWEQKATLSSDCKASPFFQYIETQASALQQRISSLTVPECAADIVDFDCSLGDFVTCLSDHKDQLTASCAPFLTSMENCYDSVEEICEGAHSKFLCLLHNQQSLSPDCKSSVFFDHLLAGTASIRSQIVEGIEDIQEDVQALHPCLEDLDALQCDTRDPYAAFNCLREQGQKVSQKCLQYIKGFNECSQSVQTLCTGSSSTSVISCLWEHRRELSAPCQASQYFEAIRQQLVSRIPLPACIQDITKLDCISYPPSFSATYQCLSDKVEQTCPECQEVMTDAKGCVEALKETCPVDEHFIPCVLRNRANLSPVCHASAFFGAVTRRLSTPITVCIQDILHLHCPTDSVSSALDCLVHSIPKLSPECTSHFAGAADCLTTVQAVCPEVSLQCLWAHRNELQPKCLRSSFFQRLTEILSGSLMQETTQMVECARDFARLGCQKAGSVSGAVSCALNTLNDVPPACHRYLDSMAGCVDEYHSFCQSPLLQLQWMMEHPDEVGEECHQSHFLQNFDPKSPKALVACSLDLIRLHCISADVMKSVQCLAANQDRLRNSCAALLSGVTDCLQSIQKKCSEGVSLSQLLWIFEHQERFSQQCQATPFFRLTNRLFQLGTSGLQSSGLLVCSSDIRKNSCLEGGRGVWNIMGCMQGAVQNPMKAASQQCHGALIDMFSCQEGLRALCPSDDNLLYCAWTKRSQLPPQCRDSKYWGHVLERLTSPLPGASNLAQLLHEISQEVTRFHWPCAVDQKLLGCAHNAKPADQLKCLLDNAESLTAECQEFFVGREQCLEDVKDMCPVLNLPEGESPLEKHICVFEHRHRLSQGCLASLFFRHFLNPRLQDEDQQAISDVDAQTPADSSSSSTLPGQPGTDQTSGSGASGEAGPTGTPGQPPAITIPVAPGQPDTQVRPIAPAAPIPVTKDIGAFYQGGPETGGVAFADLCKADVSHWCDNLLAANPHGPEVRHCLTGHQTDLSEPCATWNAGREVCFADVTLLCGSLETPFRCMGNTNGLSQECRSSLFYQSVVAWAKTYGMPPKAPAKPISQDQNELVIPLLAALIGVSVLILAAIAFMAYRKFMHPPKEQKNTEESNGKFKTLDDSSAKTPPELVCSDMERTPEVVYEDGKTPPEVVCLDVVETPPEAYQENDNIPLVYMARG